MRQVRAAVVDYMELHANVFKLVVSDGMDFEAYLESMRQPMRWGGYPEQMAIEELYDRCVLVTFALHTLTYHSPLVLFSCSRHTSSILTLSI